MKNSKLILIVLVSVLISGIGTWTFFKLTNKEPEFNIKDLNTELYQYLDSLHNIKVQEDLLRSQELDRKIDRLSGNIYGINRDIDDLFEELNKPIAPTKQSEFSDTFIKLMDDEIN